MLTPQTTGAETPIYTIAKCLNELIINSNFNDALEKIVGWLPQSLNIDRSYIFKNHVDENTGKVLTSIIHWWESGVYNKTGKVPAYLKSIDTSLFPEITTSLITRRPFKVSVYDDLSPLLKELMAAAELKTLLLTPVFSSDGLWGFI